MQQQANPQNKHEPCEHPLKLTFEQHTLSLSLSLVDTTMEFEASNTTSDVFNQEEEVQAVETTRDHAHAIYVPILILALLSIITAIGSHHLSQHAYMKHHIHDMYVFLHSLLIYMHKSNSISPGIYHMRIAAIFIQFLKLKLVLCFLSQLTPTSSLGV